MSYHLAVDIGASSGRLLLAHYYDYKWNLTEVHRFKNGFQNQNGFACWSVEALLEELLIGLEKVKAQGVETCSLGIDTWGVDYVLINHEGEMLQPARSYRDGRTEDVIRRLATSLNAEMIYEKTGIQFQPFNTLYQYASEPQNLWEHTYYSLLIPDYLAYCLTGRAVAEVTNASTTQLLNVKTGQFDPDLLTVAGVPSAVLPPLVEAGTYLGPLLRDRYPNYDLPEAAVYAVASHDTASAVVGIPATDASFAYISSGTWSLIGTELDEPLVSRESREANYTNERGFGGTYRFLKNITGMWMIQEIARALDYQYSYAEMAQAAAEVPPFQQNIDVNDPCFAHPDNMIEAIQTYCRQSCQTIPETVGELTMCVYSNLARSYAVAWRELEALTGKRYETLHIVGGGANVTLLNQLTANLIGKPVVAGPSEATAVGNLLVQMISTGIFETIQQARNWLAHRLELHTYYPGMTDSINEGETR